MTHPTDALRLVPIDMQIESILHDLVEEVSAAQRGARVKARARQCCARGAAKNALLNLLAAAPASPLPGGGPTCQLCANKIEGWICQGCGAHFYENDAGALVLNTIPAAPTGDA